MNRLGIRVALVSSVLAASSVTLAWALASASRLYYSGKVVSTAVIMHNGTAYVPVRDVAAALNMTVQSRGDGYALVMAGGGTQMEGLNGKIGDDLFNGSFRLKVLKVTRTEDYKRQLSSGGDVIPPAGQDVVAVAIRLKNGTQKKQSVMVFGNPVSLTDEDEHAYDLFYGDSQARNVDMLPGSAVDVVLTFWVPKSAVIKDLVYKVDCMGSSSQPFRVSLKEEKHQAAPAP